jgi:hypothetical protein
MLDKNELERIWKEDVVAYRVLPPPPHFPGGSEEDRDNTGQNIWCPERDWNQALSKYESTALLLRQPALSIV